MTTDVALPPQGSYFYLFFSDLPLVPWSAPKTEVKSPFTVLFQGSSPFLGNQSH